MAVVAVSLDLFPRFGATDNGANGDADDVKEKMAAAANDPVIGKLGTVTHAIVPGRPGEVIVHIRGGTETYIAYADVELPLQTEVLVIAQRSAAAPFVTCSSTAIPSSGFKTHHT